MRILSPFVIILCLMWGEAVGQMTWVKGAIVRGDTSRREIALVFTGHEFADGGTYIQKALKASNTRASFFFTGDFYRSFTSLSKQLHADGHYLGAHSDKHLLYCAWENRDSLLVSRRAFLIDLRRNYREMKKVGIRKRDAQYYLPPYEWYNEKIAKWTQAEGLTLVNFTSGTLSHADYTTPSMANYRSTQQIQKSIEDYAEQKGMNGFILLVHVGTDPERTDKLYLKLPEILSSLKEKGYSFVRLDEMLNRS